MMVNSNSSPFGSSARTSVLLGLQLLTESYARELARLLDEIFPPCRRPSNRWNVTGWSQAVPPVGLDSTGESTGVRPPGTGTIPYTPPRAGGRASDPGGGTPPQAAPDRQAALRITKRSSLADVAVAVGDALRRAGIHAVLTGGACANMYLAGVYASLDADFVISGSVTLAQLDQSLAELGFTQSRDPLRPPARSFLVRNSKGPLGIGEDFKIHPVWRTRRGARTLALSATDACRDRLAAFYYWNDRQALGAAQWRSPGEIGWPCGRCGSGAGSRGTSMDTPRSSPK